MGWAWSWPLRDRPEGPGPGAPPPALESRLAGLVQGAAVSALAPAALFWEAGQHPEPVPSSFGRGGNRPGLPAGTAARFGGTAHRLAGPEGEASGVPPLSLGLAVWDFPFLQRALLMGLRLHGLSPRDLCPLEQGACWQSASLVDGGTS